MPACGLRVALRTWTMSVVGRGWCRAVRHPHSSSNDAVCVVVRSQWHLRDPRLRVCRVIKLHTRFQWRVKLHASEDGQFRCMGQEVPPATDVTVDSGGRRTTFRRTDVSDVHFVRSRKPERCVRWQNICFNHRVLVEAQAWHRSAASQTLLTRVAVFRGQSADGRS